MSLDQTTLAPTKAPVRDDGPGPLTLTLGWHPDVRRIGATARIGAGCDVSRKGPDFEGSDGWEPIADPHLSRKPTRFSPTRGGVRIEPHPQGSEVRVDGKVLSGPLVVPETSVITLADRIVLVVHRGTDLRDQPDLGMVGASRGLVRVREQIGQVADLDVPVLIRGETGTGKERIAQALHEQSRRAGRSFVAVNVGALPSSTAVSELFGHVRGAFTGADRAREGAFARANGGTLFLDEIGEASPEVQVALLRVLETGELARVGSDRSERVNVRVVAATDADLEAQVRAGELREPLLHRLSGFVLQVPPLRERRDDIGRLMVHFLRQELATTGESDRLVLNGPGDASWLPAELAADWIGRDWSGNVRQLRNEVRQLVIASRGRATAVWSKPKPAPAAPKPVESADLLDVLRAHAFQPTATARALGISKTTLYARIEADDRIRKARDLTSAEIDQARASVGDDTTAMAAQLEVSERALKLRIREIS